MFASLKKMTAVAALAVGLALAGFVVTPADAAIRHDAGGAHSTGAHGARVHITVFQRGSFRARNRGYVSGNYRGHGAGYGGYDNDYRPAYGDNGYGYGCPLFPLALVVGQCN
jgi:hypothetical protein